MRCYCTGILILGFKMWLLSYYKTRPTVVIFSLKKRTKDFIGQTYISSGQKLLTLNSVLIVFQPNLC